MDVRYRKPADLTELVKSTKKSSYIKLSTVLPVNFTNCSSTCNAFEMCNLIVYYVPRRIMRVITRQVIMIAEDRRQGVVEA